MHEPSSTSPSLSSQAFWARPASERAVTFAELRRNDPVSFQPAPDFGMVLQGGGFWAVTRHADVQYVSRTPELFCSSHGVGLGEVPREVLERTATQPTELAGVPIAEGDAVVMFYESANRDEAAFEHPDRFDIARSPNHHVAFGGGGAHFCLGASLARAQLRALFTRLVERVATIEVGEVDYLTSNFVHGIKRMPVKVTPR